MNRREALKNSALLSGYAFSAGTIAAFLSGCNADPADQMWKPSFLSMDQNEMLIKLVDVILPKTDTPSASEVGVHRLIDKLMTEYCSETERKNFQEGIDKAIAAKPEDLVGYMTQIAAEAEKHDNNAKKPEKSNYRSTAFFSQLKGMTMTGYFTSEEICNNVLVYDPIPGEYIGCYPLEKTEGRAWAE